MALHNDARALERAELSKSSAEFCEQEARFPVSHFTTGFAAPKEQFERWKNLVSPLVDATQILPAAGFHASGRAWDLGRLHYVSATLDPFCCERTQEQIRNSDMDHWVLTLLLEGNVDWSSGDSSTMKPVRSVILRSLAFPFRAQQNRTRSVMIFLSRDHFIGLGSILDAAIDRPLSGSMDAIVGEFLLSVGRHMRSMTLEDAPVVANALSGLLRAAITPTGDNLAVAALPISASLFARGRLHIRNNLNNPELGPDSLCRFLGISRRQLYKIFERRHGVASYIRKLRLDACHQAIGDLADHRLISTIAYGYGFTNPDQFGRHFRAAYGYSPSEARDAQRQGFPVHKSRPANFSQWLLQVRDDQ